MTKRGITTTVAAALSIVTLVVGLFVGIIVQPVLFPPAVEMVPKKDYEAAIAERDDWKAKYEEAAKVGLSGEVQIGGLFALSGDLATFGENEKAAAELAVEQVNNLLRASGAKWTLKLVCEDTQVKPDLCLEKLESLAGRGIKLIIGPLSSGEVRAIKGYCDANKILAISQSSTAPDLAIPGDYIFRFCPTDKLGQGPAMARIMYNDGKRYVIPITRNDAWGVGLEEAGKKRFEEIGGKFLEGVRYAPEATEFSAEVADLASKVEKAIATYGADKVAVWNISFEEVVTLFTAAKEYAVLRKVTWYGSDGTLGSAELLKDPAVREFTMAVKYPCTIFAPTRSAKWDMVRQNGIKVLGREPESYSYAVYDIVWAYALSLMVVDRYDSEAVRAVLPTVTASMFGASGWIELDEAGDRKVGNYVIWAIVEKTPGTYEWIEIGEWDYISDSVKYH